MTDRLVAFEIFAKVVEGKSFTAAARALGTSQSRVSKAIAALERRLDARLFVRSTRHITLTPAGSEFYQQARTILAAVEDAEGRARRSQGEIEGRLRVNTSAMLAASIVLPALLAFGAEHPKLSVEIVMDDRRIDPVEQGSDLIVRVGALDDSRLVTRRAGSAAVGIYAGAGYLDRAGVPHEMADLAAHRVIGALTRSGMRADPLDRGPTTSTLAVSNALLAHAAAVADAGIAALPEFMAAPDVKAGRLVRLGLEPKPSPIEISLLHPFAAEAPAKVRAFMDFAIKRWRASGDIF